MGGGAFLTFWGCVMLGLLLMLCRSSMVCKAIGHGAPNLARYEWHFPALIPDLVRFLQEKRREQVEMGTEHNQSCVFHSDRNPRSRRSPRSTAKHTHSGVSPGKHYRTKGKASDGLYVLDLLSQWDKQVEVWGTGVDEIDVVLRSGQAWTHELEQYKTTKTLLTASLEHESRERPNRSKVLIRMEPFGGFTSPHESRGVINLIRKLPCRFFRLSKWVFDTELGALAMIYVQVARSDVNMVARLALFHAPKNLLQTMPRKLLSKSNFNLWIYENPFDSEPVPEDKIDPQKLLATLKWLPAIEYLRNRTSPHTRDPSYSLSCDHDHNSHNHPSVKRNDIKCEVPRSDRELEVAAILESWKDHP